MLKRDRQNGWFTMVKSKIKRNPYAQYMLNQLEMIEQQRQYWLKHPREFARDLIRFAVYCNKNISLEDKMNIEKTLEGQLNMVTEKDIGKKCIALWGEADQIRQTVEECAELIVVLAKYGRNVNGSSKDQICEELADVEIMINQMKLIFDADIIESQKRYKLARLNERVTFEKGQFSMVIMYTLSEGLYIQIDGSNINLGVYTLYGDEMKIENEKMYRRGIDYPAYREGVKMHLCMSGKELKEWFSEEELTKENYPHPDAYHGSLQKVRTDEKVWLEGCATMYEK